MLASHGEPTAVDWVDDDRRSLGDLDGDEFVYKRYWLLIKSQG